MLVFKASTSAVASLCFTADGRGLATGAHHDAGLWDVSGTPQLLRAFDQTGWAAAAAVSPCGRFFVAGGNALRVFDLSDPNAHPRVLSSGSAAVAFAPDGTEFAATGFAPRQYAVPSWELIRGDSAPSTPEGGEFCTGALAYTPDGKSLALTFAVARLNRWRYDWEVRLFDRRTGAHTRTLPAAFGYVSPAQLAFSPDGAVVAGSFGPVLGVVSVAGGAVVARVKAGTKHLTGLAFTPDGSKLVAVSNDARVRVFDARTWTEVEGYEWKVGRLRSVAVAPDGLRMAAGSDSGRVVIWDVDG